MLNNISLNVPSIIFSSDSFGIFRKEIINNLGLRRASMLIEEFGRSYANEIIEKLKLDGNHLTIRELMDLAEEIHREIGQITSVVRSGHITRNEDGQLQCHNMSGIWHGSFEAAIHLKHHGQSKMPTCFTLCGFAKGYLDSVFNGNFIVKELSCVAQGHEHCSFTIELSKEEQQANITILDELNETYDTIFKQRNIFEKTNILHEKFNTTLLNKKNIQKFLNEAASLINKPILLSYNANQFIMTEQVDETIGSLYEQNFELINKVLTKKKSIQFITIANLSFLSYPIILENKVTGHCSFYYEETVQVEEGDNTFIEVIASLISLYLANERSTFIHLERSKNSLLNQLLFNLENPTHLLSLITTQDVGFDSPYRLIAIDLETNERSSSKNLYDYQLKISEAFTIYQMPKLITIYDNKFICLIPSSSNLKEFSSTLKRLIKRLSPFKVRIGISEAFTQLELLPKAFKEAQLAIQFPHKDMLIFFSDLGLLGILIREGNIEDIKSLAQQQLKELLQPKKKYEELLVTLYQYLKNGQKLEVTMKHLNLSLGGIHYRIKKIEDLLQVDLKDPTNISYLLLLLEALIVLGELPLKSS